jgi:thiol-disulfide isomerase/thioredoxin
MSLVIYLSGIFTGFYIQKSTIEYTEKRIFSLQKRLENIQLEYMYLSTMGKDVSCNLLSVLVDETNVELWEIGKQLVYLENSREDPERISELTSEYSLLSVRAWILNSYVNQRCEDEKVVILYFYSVPCQECARQGEVLDQLRDELFKDEMRVFVLNINLEESIVQDLVKTYNISKTPSLVIGNSTYEGLVERDILKTIIESSLS